MIEIGIIIVSITYIWNHSGFMFDFSKWVYKILNPHKPYNGQPLMKPFGCFLCMTFWTVLGYSIFGLELSIIYSLGISVASAILSLLVDKLLMVIIRGINLIK